MNTKLMTGLGCLLLAAAAISPGVLGHDDVGGTTSGVYGTYYGASGPAVVPNGDANPQDTISAGQMLCDMEVLDSGAAPGAPDETKVDGGSGGMAPDGTFDDGGQGGACHTTHYDYPGYNTAGCLNSVAYASDASTVDPWIGASCDFETVTGGTPQSQIFTTCVVNGVLTQNVGTIVGCVTDFIACTASPVGCTVDGVRTCGSDAIADGINYGHGSAGVAFPYSTGSAQQGTAFEDAVDDEAVNDIDCTDADATSAVFVFDAVVVDGANSHAHPATTGVITS